MTKTNHNLALLIQPTEDLWNISWRAGNMLLNRFHIDEDAAFESAGIYNLSSNGTNNSKGKDLKLVFGNNADTLLIVVNLNTSSIILLSRILAP